MAAKRKVTITLDEERPLPRGARHVSAQLNEAGWELVERRRRREGLVALLDELDRTDGPLPADPEEDARLARLLGGTG